MNDQKTAQLAVSAQQGNEDAFGILYKLYRVRLIGFIRSLIEKGDQDNRVHDAEDIAQDAFIRAWSNIGELQNPMAFQSWLFQIARNQAANFLNSGYNRIIEPTDPVELVSVSDKTQSAPPDVEETEDPYLEALQAAVFRLSETLRHTYILRYRRELSIQEIAEIEGVPVGTVKRRLHDTREQIYGMLGAKK